MTHGEHLCSRHIFHPDEPQSTSQAGSQVSQEHLFVIKCFHTHVPSPSGSQRCQAPSPCNNDMPSRAVHASSPCNFQESPVKPPVPSLKMLYPEEPPKLSQAVLRTDADVLLPVVHQPLVHLIADAQDVVLHTQVCDELQLPAAEHLQRAGSGAEMSLPAAMAAALPAPPPKSGQAGTGCNGLMGQSHCWYKLKTTRSMGAVCMS